MHKRLLSSILTLIPIACLCLAGLAVTGCASTPDDSELTPEERQEKFDREREKELKAKRQREEKLQAEREKEREKEVARLKEKMARDRESREIDARLSSERTPAYPSATPSGEEAEWSPLVIRPGSQLNIQVYVAGEVEVDIPSVRVSEAGTITLPLIGTIRIAGRPLRTVSQIIESLYGNYYVKPQVRMDILRDEDSDSFPWGFVTVLGRVKQQGRVAIPPTRDLTVSSAIQQAGGFDSSARITAIRVTRKLANGESEAIDVNMRNVGKRGRTDEDITLHPNDVVFVPEMLF